MSVQSQINRINSAVSDSYTAVSDKGGTLPTSKVIANLATAINSIPGTTDYNELDNIPEIGGKLVKGNQNIGYYGGVVDDTGGSASVGNIPVFSRGDDTPAIMDSGVDIGSVLTTTKLQHISITATLSSSGGSTVIGVTPNVTPWAISAVPYTVDTGDSYGRAWTVVPTLVDGKVNQVTVWAKNHITRIDITIIGTL